MPDRAVWVVCERLNPRAAGFAAGDFMDQGPVEIAALENGLEARLGRATTLRAALERWPQLRAIGNQVEFTYAGDAELLARQLSDDLEMATPEGWIGREASAFPELTINGEPYEFDLTELPWERVAVIGGEWGCYDVSQCGDWLCDDMTDGDPTYRYVPDADLDAEARALLLSPPAWPIGPELELQVEGVIDEGSLIDLLLHGDLEDAMGQRGKATERYDAITLNGLEIWRRQADPG
jgi:hypothetical protein